MAGFLIVRDRDSERLRMALDRAARELSGLGLVTDSLVRGDTGIAWGAPPEAPVDRAHTDAHDVVLLGDVIPGPGPQRLTAVQYGLEAESGGEVPRPYDGYHLAVVLKRQGDVLVAGDPMGIFPVHHAFEGEVLWVASSPALLGCHSAFRTRIDPRGLAGVLMTNGPVAGRMPLRGVRRLHMGHVLVAPPKGAPREVKHHEFPLGQGHHETPHVTCMHLMHEALLSSARRHYMGEAHALMLSGGADSRLMAGVLARLGIPVQAVTRGLPSDIEYRCARGVARRLGMPHRLVGDGAAGFRGFAQSIRWSGLSHSPGTGGGDNVGAILRDLCPRVTSGYLTDSILGGAFLYWKEEPGVPFNTQWAVRRLTRWGIPPEGLRKLLRRDVFGEASEELVRELGMLYEQSGETPFQRQWRFGLCHRQRFAVGNMIPHLAMGAWPRQPQLDREVFAVVGNLPAMAFHRRHVEHEMLKHQYPQLARLPLDRNAFDTTPMLPGTWDHVRAGASRLSRRIAGRLGVPLGEHRYYYRTFDFNGPVWREIRQEAEPHRERAYALFDRDTYDALVPRPSELWSAGDGIHGSAAPKMLLAVAVWLGGLDGA